MKKIVVLLCMMLFCSGAFAEVVFTQSVTKENFWEKNGIEEQKVYDVGHKIIRANNLKRAPIVVEKTPKIINAFSNQYNKKVFISKGMLPYIENDDELAYILSHELSHSQEAYDGFIKLMAMNANSKKYEYKADLNGIDYMVKAGYNPVAAIIMGNRILDEPLWDWGFLSSHPKGSKRLVEMYKYIYVKYPQYLNSPMTQNIVYANFLSTMDYEIKKFEQKQKKRQLKQGNTL